MALEDLTGHQDGSDTKPKGPAERKKQRLAYAAIAVGIVGALIAWLAYRKQQSSAAAQSSSYVPSLGPTQGIVASGGATGTDAEATNYQNLAQAIEQLRGDYEDLYNSGPDDAPAPAGPDPHFWDPLINALQLRPVPAVPPFGSDTNPRGNTAGEDNFPTPAAPAPWDPVPQTATTVPLPGAAGITTPIVISSPHRAANGTYTNVVAYQGQQYTVIGAKDPTRTWGHILNPRQAAAAAAH